ncbi:MAG: haloacid dehalogenase type II [Proteobacteria bacterium]|nr:haloacid dehalogenase type II [Pseudomonadota bacterium]
MVATSISESTAADTPPASPGVDRKDAASVAVKACVFDTFGTVVDWRSSVIAEATEWGKARGLNINWVEFTDRWRLGYMPAMNKVRRGEIPWTRLDDLHQMILEDLLKQYRIEGLSDQEKVHWAHVWRRLKPWPDAVEGLTRLKRKYIISPMSNGNVALMTHLAKFGGLPWDLVLGTDLVQHYKPDREMYLSAPLYLDLEPQEVMMCAAHVGDLRAARNCGLRTAFIHRPHEYGDGVLGVPDKASPGDFDVVAESITDLAQQLGA